MHEEHVTKIQITGQDVYNWSIQFSCACGKVIADELEFTLPDLNGLAINHIIEYTGQSISDDGHKKNCSRDEHCPGNGECK